MVLVRTKGRIRSGKAVRDWRTTRSAVVIPTADDGYHKHRYERQLIQHMAVCTDKPYRVSSKIHMIKTRCKVRFMSMGEPNFSGVVLDNIQVVQGVCKINKYFYFQKKVK